MNQFTLYIGSESVGSFFNKKKAVIFAKDLYKKVNKIIEVVRNDDIVVVEVGEKVRRTEYLKPF
jgi:hypothetical protein